MHGDLELAIICFFFLLPTYLGVAEDVVVGSHHSCKPPPCTHLPLCENPPLEPRATPCVDPWRGAW